MTERTGGADNLKRAIHHFAAMIAGFLGFSGAAYRLIPEAEDADHVQVERGAVFAAVLLDPAGVAGHPEAVERLIAVASPDRLSQLIVVDRTGHYRPVYRPLLLYAWLQAFRLAYETLPRAQFGRWEEATRAWCDNLEFRLGEFVWAAEARAVAGDGIAEACWIALALHVAGRVFIRDAWTDLAADVFGKLVRRQQPSGAFLAATPSDNPEAHWFHELVILHAAGSYAVQTEDRALAAAVARATRFHLNETQPDHATNQPWGLFAFIWNPATRPLADGMLHTLAIHAGQERLRREDEAPDPSPLPRSAGGEGTNAALSGITLMLLADVLYCLRLFN